MTGFRVLFRAACSREEGTGHLRRCLTLARELVARGASVGIVTEDNPLARSLAFSSANLSVHFVAPGCLFADLIDDVAVVVIDMPKTDEQLSLHPDWIGQLRQADRAGVSVVSLGHVSASADCFRAVIDLYPSRTVHAVNYLEGPEYLILRPEFAASDIADGAFSDQCEANRVLVSMGGSDPQDLTGTAIKALIDTGVTMSVDLVIGSGYCGDLQAWQTQATAAGLELTVHRDLGANDMARLMRQSTLALVAFGTTAYELMALGRVAAAFTHYSWQEASAQRFESLGAIRYLGCAESVLSCRRIAEQVRQLLADRDAMAAMAKKGQALVDGRGACRVADLLQTYAQETRDRQLDLLYVVAHPGDELMGAGATLIRQIDEGLRVGLVVLGEGSASRWNEPGPSQDRELAQRGLKTALQQVADQLGLSAWYYYRFEDNRFDGHDRLDLVKVVESVIRRHCPHTVYTHHPADLNIDHRLCFEAVITATRPQPECPVTTVYSIETPSSTDWGSALGHGVFQPNWFESVAATLERKLALLELYQSELRDDPHPRSLAAVADQARYWGRRIGVPSAEAFVLQRHLAATISEQKHSERQGES